VLNSLRIKSRNVHALQAGSRGLFSVIVDHRKLTIMMAEFQTE
jgi:hypothetical protein